MVISASRNHGQGPSEHFMVIMKDTRPHTLSHLLVIISLVMAAVGNYFKIQNFLSPTTLSSKDVACISVNYVRVFCTRKCNSYV